MMIYNNYLSINEMIRPGILRIKTEKVLLCPIYKNNIISYLESLKYQDELYLSYNYIINNEGKIINIIPKDEVAYPTSNIELNFKCLSIGIYLNSKYSTITIKEKNIFKKILKDLCNEYNLNLKKDIIIKNSFLNTREFEYYIDNMIHWHSFLEEISTFNDI